MTLMDKPTTEPGNLLVRLGYLRDALSPDATYTGLGRARILQDAIDEIERLRNALEKIADAWERTPREGESHLENAGQTESIIDKTLAELGYV